MLVWQAHKSRIRHMAFSPDGSELATTAGTSKFVWLWRAATGELVRKLDGHRAHARAVAYSPDGRYFASTQNASTTNVWDRVDGALVAGLTTIGWCIESLAFRSDSSAVAVTSSQKVKEWRCADFSGTGEELTPVGQFDVWVGMSQQIGFSPCGRYFMAGNEMIDAHSRAKLQALNDPLGSAFAAQFSFAPDGETVAVVYGLRIHLIEPATGRDRVALRGHPNFIHAVGFMPDGREVVSAGADGIVRIWNPITGTEVRQMDWGIGKICAAAVSPDGTLCAAGGENGQVVVWDVDT